MKSEGITLPWKLTWQKKATADEADVKSVASIPGLTLYDGHVSGPWDAVSVALQRPGPYKMPVEAAVASHYLGDSAANVAFHKLRDFQKHGVRYILDRWNTIGAALLADDMGLGKTVQVIRASDVMGGTRLVVAPRTVIETWKNEIKKWSRCLDFVNIKTREQAAGIKNYEGKWVLISYDLIPYLWTSLKPNVLIIDEAHNFAGRAAKRGKRLKNFAALAENRIALTGTPIWSRPRDFWMLFKILFGATFGSAWDFDEAYCAGKLNEYGGMDNKGKSRSPELKHRTSFYMLRRLKKDVAKELPTITRTVRWVDPVQAATVAMKRAFLHRGKGDYYRALAACADAKLEAAMEVATDARDFLLVTGTKAHARYMHQELNNRGVPCELITGEVAPRLREVLMRRAAKKRHGVVATIDVCREGVDGYQHVTANGIMHTLDFVPNKILQYEGRLNRIGQSLPVTITYLVMKEAMDSWVLETVVNKLDQWKSLIDETGEGLNRRLKGQRDDQSDEQLEKEVLKQIYKSFKS